MPTQDELDYQEYLDYQDYQKHIASQTAKAPPPTLQQSAPVAQSTEDVLAGLRADSSGTTGRGFKLPMVMPIPSGAGGGVVGAAAKGVAGAARAGAAEGALQGAGQSMDEPTLQGRIGHTVAGAATGGALGGISGLIGKGAQAAKDAKLFSKPAKAADWAQDQFSAAKGKLEQYLTGQTNIVEQGVKGKPINLDLEQIRQLESINPKLGGLVDEAYSSATPRYTEQAGPMGPTQVKSGETIPGELALPLKRAVGEAANFRTRGTSDPLHIARSEDASKVYGPIADQINAISPEVAAANEMVSQKAIPLRDLLENKGMAENQMSKLLSPETQATIGRVDELAGSNLADAASRMQTAKYLQLDPTKLATLGIGQETVKTAARGLSEGANMMSKAPANTRESLQQALIALQNRKKK